MNKTGTTLLIGTGLAALGAVLFASHKSSTTTEAIKDAVKAPVGTPPSAMPSFVARVTGYWPFSAKPSEQRMEGGMKDRKGAPLHTIEDFFAGKSDHVSCSGDDAVFPYGQKITFPWIDGRAVVGRVTDTGSHFRGASKAYRVVGQEPLDVCVASSSTSVPKTVTAKIVAGDNYDNAKAVAIAKMAGQVVAGLFAGDYETDELHLENSYSPHELPENYESETIRLNQRTAQGLPTDYETNIVDLLGDF